MYKILHYLPAGCIFPGVNDLTKSSGVINTSLSSPMCTTLSVAKYLKTLSGVLYCLIRFSYSIIWRTSKKIHHFNKTASTIFKLPQFLLLHFKSPPFEKPNFIKSPCLTSIHPYPWLAQIWCFTKITKNDIHCKSFN